MPSRSRVSLIHGLSRRKVRQREGLFLAEGVRVVEDLLDSPIVPRLALLSSPVEDTARGRALVERLAGTCEVERVTEAEMGELTDTDTSQGVMVVAETPRARIADVRPGPTDVVLLLDAVQDPGNAGTLIRTADAFGCAAVLAAPGTVDPWNPKVVRAAAGSLFRMPVVEVGSAALREWLEAEGVTAYAGDAAGTPIAEVAMRGPALVAVGNEGAGLSDAVAALATMRVAIPIRGAVESLNVAVAAGILLHELTTRLSAGAERRA